MLPFGKWFLDKKKKNNEEEKKKNVQLSQPDFELPLSHMASQHLPHCATYIYTSVNRKGESNHIHTYSRLKCFIQS